MVELRVGELGVEETRLAVARSGRRVMGGMNSGLFQQLLRGDYCIEKAVAFNAAVKLSEIDQHEMNGRENAIWQFHARNNRAQKLAILKEAA